MAAKVTLQKKEMNARIDRDTQYLRILYLGDEEVVKAFVQTWQKDKAALDRAFHKFVQEQARHSDKAPRKRPTTLNPYVSTDIRKRADKAMAASAGCNKMSKLIRHVLANYINKGDLIPIKTKAGKFKVDKFGNRQYHRPPSETLNQPNYVPPKDEKLRCRVQYDAGKDHQAIKRLMDLCGVTPSVFFSWVIDQGAAMLEAENNAAAEERKRMKEEQKKASAETVAAKTQPPSG